MEIWIKRSAQSFVFSTEFEFEGLFGYYHQHMPPHGAPLTPTRSGSVAAGTWMPMFLPGYGIVDIVREAPAIGWCDTTLASERSPRTCPVNLAFATEELRALCEIQVEGERAFGMETARQLRERLASMREADNVVETVTAHPQEIPAGRRRCYEVLLPENYRMVLCANHKHLPLLKATGGVDWSRVSRVVIYSIEKVEVARG